MSMEEDSFDKRMRAATKDIHSVSDALVNAKLAFSLSNNDVWAEGLLVFYEIFRFLEEAVNRNKNTLLDEVFIEEMRRTEAFEDDLQYYLGHDWKKTYEIRESVASYLNHLRSLEQQDPKLLIAYVYHLYMGLFSGGQILRYKRNFPKKLGINPNEMKNGNKVTDFGEISTSTLKKQLRDRLNNISQELSEDDQIKLLEESKNVFKLNNEIIRSVKSTDSFIRRRVMYLSFFALLIIFIFISLRN